MTPDPDRTGPDRRPGFVTFGETLGTFSSLGSGPLMRGDRTTVSFAGSESNVAIGLARLGSRVRWIGCLGDDAVGTLIRRELRAEGVEVSARTVPDRPTATMLKERVGESRWRVSYARSGSAGSQIGPTDVARALIADAHHLHLTGITPALGASARAATAAALDLADEHALTVSFDVNHRDRLWSRAEAARAFAGILPRVGTVFASLDEVDLLLGEPVGDNRSETALTSLAARVARIGPAEVVFTLGAEGSFAWTAETGGRWVAAEPAVLVDPVGAGDSFVAGYLHARLVDVADPRAAAVFGNRVARHVVSTQGDWEGAPTIAMLAQASGDNVAR